MKIEPIKSEREYRQALASIDVLLDAPRGSPEAETLELLSILVEAYEERMFPLPSRGPGGSVSGGPIPESDPVTAILFWMDQNGLSARDLEPFLGDRAKVTAILARQRALTLTMIRNLSMKLGIPAEVLIPPYRLAQAA